MLDGQKGFLKDKIIKNSRGEKDAGFSDEFENDGIENTIPKRLKDMRKSLKGKNEDVMPGEKWTPNRNKINMVGYTPDKKNVNPFMMDDNDPAKYNDTVQSQVENVATNMFV